MTVRSLLLIVAITGCAVSPDDSIQIAGPSSGLDAVVTSSCCVEGDARPLSSADLPPRSFCGGDPVEPSAPAVTAVQGGAPVQDPCREGMVLVDGEYCTDVRQDCVTWEEPPANPFARCARFAPSICLGKRIHKRFCVDREEYVSPGEALPAGEVSWSEARRLCEKDSKRLCFETEWELACEGDAMLPYPTGYDRDPQDCNIDKEDLVDPTTGRLRDKRVPSSQLERCVSPFGVVSMTGNVDEWVWRDRTAGEQRSALKGGWWMPGRDRCRPATTAHGESFRDVQTGFRCCSDARP